MNKNQRIFKITCDGVGGWWRCSAHRSRCCKHVREIAEERTELAGLAGSYKMG